MKNLAKFTSGPWHVDSLKPGDTLIAETARHSIRGPYDERATLSNESAYELDRANAALIAAAPELYEASGSVSISGPDDDGLFWLKIQGSQSASINLGELKSDLAYVAIAEWMEKRNSALKKARGES